MYLSEEFMTPSQTSKYIFAVLSTYPLQYYPFHCAAWWWWCRGRWRAELPHLKRDCTLHLEKMASLLPPAHQREVTYQGTPDALLFGVAGIDESMKKLCIPQLHAKAEDCKHEHLPPAAPFVHRAERAVWIGADERTGTVSLPGVWNPVVPPNTSHHSLSFNINHAANQKGRRTKHWKFKFAIASCETSKHWQEVGDSCGQWEDPSTPRLSPFVHAWTAAEEQSICSGLLYDVGLWGECSHLKCGDFCMGNYSWVLFSEKESNCLNILHF